jgi:hypothetical protein
VPPGGAGPGVGAPAAAVPPAAAAGGGDAGLRERVRQMLMQAAGGKP